MGRDGTLYAGTGERGRIYRIDGKGTGKVFYDGDDPHIVCLGFDRQGRLIAGTDGRGLVLMLDEAGRATVLLDTDQREVTAVSVDGAGNIYAAAFVEQRRARLGPELRVRVGRTGEEEAVMEPAASPLDIHGPEREPDRRGLTAVIEGLREEAPPAPTGPEGVLYRLTPEGTVEEVWSSPYEAIYSVAAAPDGAVWFGTGSPSRIRRLEEPGGSSLVWRLREAQVTSLLLDRRGRLFAIMSNSGAAYRIGPETVDRGSFTSRPIDGGFLARWGRAWWSDQVPKGARVEIQTRTGSSPLPDGTWSSWSPPLPDSSGSPIASPPGRYLQWRAQLVGSDKGSPVVRSLTLTSQPRNRPPRIGEVTVPEAGAPPPVGESLAVASTLLESSAGPDTDETLTPRRSSPRRKTRWAVFRADDPDADALIFRLTVTSAEGTERQVEPLDEGAPPLRWDDSLLPEGVWTLSVEASDEKNNPPGTERSVRAVSRPFEVDRTPPVLTLQDASARSELRIRARDALSVLRRAEYSHDGARWRAAAIADGILDGPEEEILIRRTSTDRPLQVRVIDAAGNETLLDLDSAESR
jgi:hypothetical protein